MVADLEACPRPPEGCATTIGAYDGVHRGHRVVIEGVRRIAEERGLRSAVVTFDRHPARVVRPDSAPQLLTDLSQKLELLAETGLDYALVLHFDEARSKEPAEQFVREVLADCLRSRVVVVGADFHFGYRRGGNVALLEQMGAELDFDVVGLDLVDVDGQVAGAGGSVSSTAIRAALGDGDAVAAAEMLGRLHELRGTVVAGDGRSGGSGLPTAKVVVDDELLVPGDGSYAGWYERPDGTVHAAVISTGSAAASSHPAPEPALEAHLLDFDGDLSGEAATVRFVTRLAEQSTQLERSCEQARAVLDPARNR